MADTKKLRIVLIRPGATEFDDQGRIKGTLDMPLSEHGREQADRTARQLQQIELACIYAAPCESATTTARLLADGRHTKIKTIESLQNIDHGLWHGKLIEEVRRQQPRVYRQGMDSPDSLCPPGGEAVQDARDRLVKALRKIAKKHRRGVIALVIPEPLASVARSLLSGDQLRDLWKSETDSGVWELLELERHPVAVEA